MTNWYYKQGEEDVGPIEEKTFLEWYRTGAVGPKQLVRNDDMQDWQEAGTLNLLDRVSPVEQECRSLSLPLRLDFDLSVEDILKYKKFYAAKCAEVFPVLDKPQGRSSRPIWTFI